MRTIWRVAAPLLLGLGALVQAERMRAMRRLVAEFNVFRWAGRMLVDAGRVRQQGRLSGRLTMGLQPAPVEAAGP